MFNRVLIAASVALMLVAVACGDAGPADDPDRVKVVATTTILGDLARNVVGSDGDVQVLVPAGVDPHDFQASARQVAAIVAADLVIANGVLLEQGLDDVLDAAFGDGANVVRIGDLLNPQQFLDADSNSELDPHVWLDPLRMADAAGIVAAELALIGPDIDWAERAEAYATQLRATDQEIQALLAAVPVERRVLVTNHDSLGYFATRYDFRIAGVVVPGGSTLAEPSSAEVAALVAKISESGVAAIFAETTDTTTLADAVAAEAGRDVAVVELYTGSLGEAGSGAETLIDMLLTNARRIVDGLS